METKLTELNKNYQFARAEYLNFVEEENFDIPVKVFDETRQRLLFMCLRANGKKRNSRLSEIMGLQSVLSEITGLQSAP